MIAKQLVGTTPLHRFIPSTLTLSSNFQGDPQTAVTHLGDVVLFVQYTISRFHARIKPHGLLLLLRTYFSLKPVRSLWKVESSPPVILLRMMSCIRLTNCPVTMPLHSIHGLKHCLIAAARE